MSIIDMIGFAIFAAGILLGLVFEMKVRAYDRRLVACRVSQEVRDYHRYQALLKGTGLDNDPLIRDLVLAFREVSDWVVENDALFSSKAQGKGSKWFLGRTKFEEFCRQVEKTPLAPLLSETGRRFLLERQGSTEGLCLIHVPTLMLAELDYACREQ